MDQVDLVDQVAEIKRSSNIAITDEAREREIVETALAAARPELAGEVGTFVRTLLSLSKFRQRKLLFDLAEDPLLPPPAEPTRSGSRCRLLGKQWLRAT